jgi:hypothetical protein
VKMVLACLLLVSGSIAASRTLAPVDAAIADRFTRAFVAGDTKTVSELLSDEVTTRLYLQTGPDGSKKDFPEDSGKAAAIRDYQRVIAAVGKPEDSSCVQPDGVSLMCDDRFSQPDRGMKTMILFDGKKIGSLMIMYGGAAIHG